MKNIFIAGCALALSLMAFAACKHDPSKHAVAQAPAGKYICPMNCEKGKFYDQPGACPVCNMDLVQSKADTSIAAPVYFTAFSATPAQLEAGKPAQLSFTPKIKGNESAPVPLDLVHEKKMHLILVSDDLSWFDHIHPEYTATGSYDIKVLGKGENFSAGSGHNETRFENGGKFWAFADFKPTGGLNQVDKIELDVAGPSAKPLSYAAEKRSATVNGYALTMAAEGALSAENHQHINVSIKKDGKAVDPAGFENYLGEKAHLVMVEVASKEFVHTHPAVENGQLAIHTTFAQPGTYRAWLQFQTNGKVHTADFVLRVGAGKTGHEGHNH
jgi:hypothetical protein